MCNTRYSVTITDMGDDMQHTYCTHFEYEPGLTS